MLFGSSSCCRQQAGSRYGAWHDSGPHANCSHSRLQTLSEREMRTVAQVVRLAVAGGEADCAVSQDGHLQNVAHPQPRLQMPSG
jgi:hypothetical protein